MDKGWILLHRSILDHWIYKTKRFSEFQAWIDLLLLAEHTTHKQMWRGKLTEFKRGDVCLSITRLAERWGWSRNKTRRFLNQLEEDEMIHLIGHQNRTVLTIVNYDNFQNARTPKRTPKRTSDETPDRTSDETSDETYLKNKEIIIKEKKEKPSADPVQEEEEETWNGKRIEDLTYEEWCEYVDSWPEEEEQT